MFDSFMQGPRCSLHSSHVGTTYLVIAKYCTFNHSYLLHLSTCVSQTQATSVGSVLPTALVSPDVVFDKVGIDYAEPISISLYHCQSIHLCLSLKAVHLDPVSDLTIEAFIQRTEKFTLNQEHSQQIVPQFCSNQIIQWDFIYEKPHTSVACGKQPLRASRLISRES